MNAFAMWFVLGLHIERRGNKWTTWEVDPLLPSRLSFAKTAEGQAKAARVIKERGG